MVAHRTEKTNTFSKMSKNMKIRVSTQEVPHLNFKSLGRQEQRK